MMLILMIILIMKFELRLFYSTIHRLFLYTLYKVKIINSSYLAVTILNYSNLPITVLRQFNHYSYSSLSSGNEEGGKRLLYSVATDM